MKKYHSFFRLRFSMGLQYRAAALAGMATQFFWGLMEILVFQAFYSSNTAAFPMSMQAISSYVWLQQAFLALFMVWMMENEIFDSILEGTIVYDLCRPVHIYSMWFARSLANRTSRALLRCIPLLTVTAFLPSPWGLSAPADPLYFLLFLISLILGLLVVVAFCLLIYGLTFFTISPQGLRILCSSVVEFFSGAIIPLPFFPERLQRVMELTPFAAMQNVALRVYSGSMTLEEIRRAMGLQLFWLTVLVWAGWQLCRTAERRITIQGG